MKRRYGYPPPKKSLGQVMLVDGLIAREIIDSLDLTSTRNVLEIGPGRGILTDYLILKNANVSGCEIDERMAALLKSRFGVKPNFNLIIKDIMELELGDLFNGEKYIAIGNLPYHLTSEILFKFFDLVKNCWDQRNRPPIDSLTVMIQKEVADRLLSHPGTKNWGVLSIFASLYAELERVLEVPADCFKPKPKVDSTVIRLKFRPQPPFEIADYTLFRELIRASFGNRRKMLKNTLAKFDLPEETSLDLRQRPEDLEAKDFAALAKDISTR